MGHKQPGYYVVSGKSTSCAGLIEALRAAGIRVPVLGPSAMATRELAARAASIGDVVVAAPFDLSENSPALDEFAARFRAKCGSDPSPLACYAYDTAQLVVAAIGSAGLNRARIRDALARTTFNGITGRVEFDSLRGNATAPVLMTVKAGRWTKVEPAADASARK